MEDIAVVTGVSHGTLGCRGRRAQRVAAAASTSGDGGPNPKARVARSSRRHIPRRPQREVAAGVHLRHRPRRRLAHQIWRPLVDRSRW